MNITAAVTFSSISFCNAAGLKASLENEISPFPSSCLYKTNNSGRRILQESFELLVVSPEIPKGLPSTGNSREKSSPK